MSTGTRIEEIKDRERVEEKIKVRGGVDGNGMMVKSEVNFWKAEYFKCLLELRNANRGLSRLSKTKKKYTKTVKAVNQFIKTR